MSDTQPIVETIWGSHYVYTSEDELQEALAETLAAQGYKVEREVRLDDRDRIDLMVDDDIGVEVKVDGDAAGTFEQLQRYAAHKEIRELVLVTNRWQEFPEKAGEKPLTVVNLVLANL